MGELRKVTDLYIDQGNSRLVDSQNSTLYVPDQVTPYGSKVLFRARLQYSDGSAFPIEAGTVFYFAVDNSYSDAHADLVNSLNDQFNVSGDWAAQDLQTGQICWRADFSTTDLKTALGTSSSVAMTAELWMQAPGSDYALLCQWPITIKNVVADITGTPAGGELTFATVDSLNARIAEGITFEKRGSQMAVIIDGVEVAVIG